MARKFPRYPATRSLTEYTLDEAWFYFASDEQRESYRSKGQNPAESELLAFELRRFLVDKLAVGELDASGVQTEPVHSNKRDKIPPVLFEDAAIDWHASIVRGYGRIYEGVRVHGTWERIPQPLRFRSVEHPSESPAIKGRPSKLDEITEIVDELAADGIDLAKLPRKAAWQEIRKRAEEKRPGTTKIGYSDPVIQRALVRRFGRRK